MSNCKSNSATSTTLAPARSVDPAWAHAGVVPGQEIVLKSVYCNKTIRGGRVTRLKYHLVGIPSDVEECKKAPGDIKWKMKELVNELKKNKEKKKKINSEIGSPVDLPYDDVDDDNERHYHGAKWKRKEKECGKSIGVFNRHLAPTMGLNLPLRVMYSKEMIDKAKKVVANWWYNVNLLFNAAQSNFYKPAIDAMAAIRLGFKSHSLHELREKLLNSGNEVQNYLLDIKKFWNELLFTNGKWLDKPEATTNNQLSSLSSKRYNVLEGYGYIRP